jgi:3-dehydroquinate dehydratase/shikimate dehydrogenase
MVRAALVATLLDAPSLGGQELMALPRSVEWLEVRADLIGDPDPVRLRRYFKGRLIYTLRSGAEGGDTSDASSRRIDRIAAAANHYDLVSLEGDRDLSPRLLAAIPSRQRMISWHGRAMELGELRSKFARFSAVEARFYRLVQTVSKPGDEFVPLFLLKSLARADTISYTAGPAGLWTRLVALSLGSPAIFGAVGSGRDNSDEPTITRLIQDYGLPAVVPVREIYGIAGNPVSHSLSPRLHNAAYRAAGHAALFVPFHVESFSEFWRTTVDGSSLESLGMRLKGLTVASPHKEDALGIANVVRAIARRAESANILVRVGGHWDADTTDPEVVFVTARERGVVLRSKRAAVIGCGGAGRAIAAALSQSGAEVTLVNRSPQRGKHAAKLLRLPYIPLQNFSAQGYDILVNATPLGREDDQSPVKPDSIDEEAVVIDLVYGSRPTALVSGTLGPKRVVIDGRDVLLTQVRRQFRLMTGCEMPLAVASNELGRPIPQARRPNTVSAAPPDDVNLLEVQ